MSDVSCAFDQLNEFNCELSDRQMYFLVSHKEKNGEYASYKIDFNSIAVQLNSSIESFKSAAYCQSSDFATKTHDHDIYTSAMYESKIYGGESISVMNMQTASNTYTMSISAIDSSEVQDVDERIYESLPKLGTVRLMSVKDLMLNADRLDYRNEMFTGWISAGSKTTYNLNEFVLSSDIPNVFNSSGNQFTIPCLTDFFKINDDLSTSDPYTTKNGVTHIPIHTHEIDNSNGSHILLNSNSIEVDKNEFNDTIKGLLRATSTVPSFHIKKDGSSFAMSGTTTKKLHNGVNNNKNFRIFLNSTTSIENQQLNNMALVEEDGTDSEVAYPTHNLMPVVIYVGPSKYSKLENYVVNI